MLYEKKMLILSGAGKGVVLIEKSGLGVKFALRTFGLLPRDGLKAGIVTKTSVFVRDLPKTVDPSAVFFIDGVDPSDVHFAVFARELYLYGTFGKKMWEANLMDLLRKHSGTVFAPVPEPRKLPPISAPTRVLPLPDGSGVPQSKVVLYGDETLADTDFYTQFDIGSRMTAVDSFLDSPRVLNDDRVLSAGNPSRPAAEITAVRDDSAQQQTESKAGSEQQEAAAEIDAAVKDAAASADGATEQRDSGNDANSDISCAAEQDAASDDIGTQTESVSADVASDAISTVEMSAATPAANGERKEDESVSTAAVKQAPKGSNETASDRVSAEARQQGSEVSAKAVHTDGDAAANGANVERAAVDGEVSAAREIASSEAVAAQAESARSEEVGMPWELTAKWLKGRSTRKPIVRRERVSAVKNKESVTKLREVMFFERSRADIEKLFAAAPRDEELNKIMPDVEWIKVAFDGHTVSVGRSGNLFLCYAVRGEYEKNSPLGEDAQWLPKLKNAPTGKGFWLIFQDLATGEILKSE